MSDEAATAAAADASASSLSFLWSLK